MNGRLQDWTDEAMADPHYCICGHYKAAHDENGECHFPSCSCKKFVVNEHCPTCGKRYDD